MDAKIDKIIKDLQSLKTKSSKISKLLLKKWDDCLNVKDINKLPITELRTLCGHFGIKSEGTKPVLSKRLWKHWEENGSEDSESESEDSDSESEESESDDEE
jgi:hypothetical protein